MVNNDGIVVDFQNVVKNFRTGKRTAVAISNLTMSVPVGKVTGLIGPDGAGKTTAMRLAAGLFMPDSGTVQVLGMDVSRDARAVQASVGYMPQRFGLYEDLTVQENLDLYADLHGVPHSVRPARYQELLDMTGMAPFSERLAGKLSGGMKQKLGLACVLVHPPELLLLDEPTVGVDPVSRRELWQIVDRFVQDEGTTVLVSTGYMDEAERCDKLFLLDEGKILSEGSPSSLSNPLRGMTFRVRGEGINRREILNRLEDCGKVADTVIQGEWVRVVTRDIAVNPCRELFSEAEQVMIEPVSPRIEDAFVTLLGAQRQANQSQPRHTARIEPSSARTPSSLSTDSNSPVIRVHNVKRRFGDFYAVKGISFDVQRGEIFGLLGANGAGKTTMFRMLCGLLPASEGELDIVGVDVRRNPAKARERIGYMSQKFSLYGSLSVLDNLQFFSSAYRLQGRHQQERLDWAMDQFELREVANMNSADLPLGFKQRLSFACALMHKPEILFLDEPTSGVDPLARREFWRRTNALAAEGVTVLVTTHFMEEADNCDRVAIMVQGEILALGTPRSIKQQAQTASKPEPTMEDAFIELISARQIEAFA